jgi:hypothetical protein
MSIQCLDEIASIIPGQLGGGLHGRVGSRKTTVAMPKGVYVDFHDDGLCRPPTTAAAVTRKFGGVSEFLVDRIVNTNGLEYSVDDYVAVCDEGYIAVLTEEAVSDGQQVYVRHTAKAGNTQLGAFRTDTDGDGAETLELTNASTANRNAVITIDGETFVVATGASANASTIAGLIATAIDGSAAFAAAAAGAVVSVTRVDGGSPGSTSLELPDGITSAYAADADPETATALPGVRFRGDWAAGAAMIKL